ncbi:MAG: hypothetical protein WC211_00780 [Dehalococcoidia bacterium]
MSDEPLKLSLVPTLHDGQRKDIADQLRWLADMIESKSSPPTGLAVALTFADGANGTYHRGPVVPLLGAMCVLRVRLEQTIED